jgi:hypothetical protein
MKISIQVTLTQAATLIIAAILLHGEPLHAQFNTWNQAGSAGVPDWSSPYNWGTFIAPQPTDNILFDVYGFASAQGAVNNVVDTPFTISTLNYSLLTASGYHTTQINPGVTLSVAPQPGAPYAIAVGEWVPSGAPVAGAANDALYYTILGTNGTLSVNGTASSIRIEQPDGTSGSHWA